MKHGRLVSKDWMKTTSDHTRAPRQEAYRSPTESQTCLILLCCASPSTGATRWCTLISVSSQLKQHVQTLPFLLQKGSLSPQPPGGLSLCTGPSLHSSAPPTQVSLSPCPQPPTGLVPLVPPKLIPCTSPLGPATGPAQGPHHPQGSPTLLPQGLCPFCILSPQGSLPGHLLAVSPHPTQKHNLGCS